MERKFHSLLKKQDDKELTDMLKASSAAYEEAKSKENLYGYIYIALAIMYVLVYIFFKDEQLKINLFMVSFCLTVSLWALSEIFKGSTLKGALFKELFDTTLFGIEWKYLLPEPGKPDIKQYAAKYKDRDISNWYPNCISENLSKEQAIAVCQYIGSYWDWALRKKYLYFLSVALGLFILSVIALLVWKQPGWQTTFLLFFSLLSFLSHFITLIKGNWTTIQKRKKIIDKLDDLIRKRHSFTPQQLRDIQDAIFTLRLEPSKIHEQFYKKYNAEIRDECEKTIGEYNEIYDNPFRLK